MRTASKRVELCKEIEVASCWLRSESEPRSEPAMGPDRPTGRPPPISPMIDLYLARPVFIERTEVRTIICVGHAVAYSTCSITPSKSDLTLFRQLYASARSLCKGVTLPCLYTHNLLVGYHTTSLFQLYAAYSLK